MYNTKCKQVANASRLQMNEISNKLVTMKALNSYNKLK